MGPNKDVCRCMQLLSFKIFVISTKIEIIETFWNYSSMFELLFEIHFAINMPSIARLSPFLSFFLCQP